MKNNDIILILCDGGLVMRVAVSGLYNILLAGYDTENLIVAI